jgi:3,4-dihydroxy 2-butanone 4-phosphate synthase/GTP cyclohydrolase II
MGEILGVAKRKVIKINKNNMKDVFQLQPSQSQVKETYLKDTTVKLPSEYGDFKLHTYISSITGDVCLAIVKGDVTNKEDVFLRLHSSCITGDIFGSRRCDCQQQLIKSLTFIEENGQGVVIYAFQEGRGIGFVNKMKAYLLQEQGLNTYEADQALGFSGDHRTYGFVKDVLEDLKVKSIALLTNNPDKVAQLEEYGVVISKRVPHQVAPCKHNKRYLETKRDITGHFLTNL